jgi:hypothetical protein
VTAPFATTLLGWKPSGKNKLGWALVPNFADVDSAESMRIAAGVLDQLAVSRDAVSDVPKDPGDWRESDYIRRPEEIAAEREAG